MSNRRTIPVSSVADLGRAVRDARKRIAGLRQRDAARLCGVSPPFLGKLERGGESVHLGKALKVCRALGIELEIRLPSREPEILGLLGDGLAEGDERQA